MLRCLMLLSQTPLTKPCTDKIIRAREISLTRAFLYLRLVPMHDRGWMARKERQVLRRGHLASILPLAKTNPKTSFSSKENVNHLTKMVRSTCWFVCLSDYCVYVVGDDLSFPPVCAMKKITPAAPQHEKGEDFYVVEEGSLRCYVTFPGEKDEVEVRTPYITGESFGELALMYNIPRAAT